MDWERRVRQSFRWSTQRFTAVERPVFQYENPKHPLNWGDVVGGDIAQHVSGLSIEVTTDPYAGGKVLAIGSVMDFAFPGDIVWGAGCIRAKSTGHAGRRLDVRAVRGPETRLAMQKAGYDVPAVFGDPALFYPEIKPREGHKQEACWGIVPHYTDVDHPVLEKWAQSGAVIIDICAGVNAFIEQLLSVDRIVSSSLHGLIMADAYGIPNARVTFHDRLFGGDFKFRDYAKSIGREHWMSQPVGIEWTLADLDKVPLRDDFKLDLEPLREAVPFK